MARQRMYFFERAYVDYVAHLRHFGARIKASGVSVWEWFWQGPGALIFEIVLQIAVVVASIGLVVLYVRYESDRGRGFSLSTLSIVIVIFIFALLVLWSWKAPLHAVARAVSGATASGSILILALLGVLATIAVFSPYLLALLLLTALSVLVFLPIRGLHGLWLLHRHITYRCPYDDCAYSGLPIHIGCGEQFSDLQPSFYGIFYHACRDTDGTDVKLPTLDFLGRNKLDRLCGGCKRPLMFSSFGELAEKPIAVIGGPTTGKTVFLCQAVSKLRDYVNALPGGKANIDSEGQRLELEQDMQKLTRGQVVSKTIDKAMAFGLAVKLPKRLRHLLYLYDAPGEDFLSMQRLGQKQSLQHIAGIVLLVDPFSLPGLVACRQRLPSDQQVSEIPLQQVVDVLIAAVNPMLLRQPTERCQVPLAVVINKADALPVNEWPTLAVLRECSEAKSEDCRDALEQLGERPVVHKLESKFAHIKYFSCSALGRMPDRRDTRPFQSVGVIEPFLWLLGLDKNR